MKRSPMRSRSGPIRASNRGRRASKYARNFGEEADRVRHMPCLACRAFAEPAHVTARGAGGVKGGRFDLVPLCRTHHREAGEARTSQRATFEREHGLDLRREADRIAALHDSPLGLREVADRWASQVEISDYDREALVGWLRRNEGDLGLGPHLRLVLLGDGIERTVSL